MTTSVGHLDGPLRELFVDIEPHADLHSPDLQKVGAALQQLAGDHDYFAPAISEMGDRSGLTGLHVPDRGPRLFLVHRKAGQMGAVHDHQVWVAIAPIVGVETHRRWHPTHPPDRERIAIAEEQAVGPSSYVTLRPPDDIHDHGHRLGVGDAAYVLILLGDDQFRYRRNEWDTETGEHRTLVPGDVGRWTTEEPFPG